MIFSSVDVFKVELLKEQLEAHDIPAVIINKQDSAYVMIGEAQLYVNRDLALRANQIIHNSLHT